MHLINVNTFQLETFYDSSRPYAILSHVWRKDGGREIDYDQLNSLAKNGPPLDRDQVIYDRKVWDWFNQRGQDFNKIFGICNLARWENLQYVWVDTCCINKSNSSELSEAINSMYSWYKEAQVCYAYLEDIELESTDGVDPESFANSQWFRRAWTLQELIAPFRVMFYDRNWNLLGDKEYLEDLLARITGIETKFLMKEAPITNASVAKRMSWAALREATRIEDVAYSLMGIFDVNMPLIYGEGRKAFIRLQEEILKETDDHSIFAWKQDIDCRDQASTGLVTVCPNPHCRNPTCVIPTCAGLSYLNKNLRGIFADSPTCFTNSGFIESFPQAKAKDGHIMITNRGIYMPSMLSHVQIEDQDVPVLLLNCREGNSDPIAVFLHREAGDQYTRAWPDIFTTCTSDGRGAIYVLKTLSTFRSVPGTQVEHAIFLQPLPHSPPIRILGMRSNPVRGYGPLCFPTLNQAPYVNFLTLGLGDLVVRIWFGIKQPEEKENEPLPWCRCEEMSQSGQGPPQHTHSPSASPHPARHQQQQRQQQLIPWHPASPPVSPPPNRRSPAPSHSGQWQKTMPLRPVSTPMTPPPNCRCSSCSSYPQPDQGQQPMYLHPESHSQSQSGSPMGRQTVPSSQPEYECPPPEQRHQRRPPNRTQPLVPPSQVSSWGVFRSLLQQPRFPGPASRPLPSMDSPQMPWPVMECGDKDRTRVSIDNYIDVSIKPKKKDGYDVFHLEIISLSEIDIAQEAEGQRSLTI